MRYLKKYKVFESKEEIDDTISVLKDLILDIKDKDLNVEVKLRRIYGTNPDKFPVFENKILMVIKKPGEDLPANHLNAPSFHINKLGDEIFQIIDFMYNQDWVVEVDNSYIQGCNFESKSRGNLPFGVEFFNHIYFKDGKVKIKENRKLSDLSEIKYPIVDFRIQFMKSK
jgi:hypothetical protein